MVKGNGGARCGKKLFTKRTEKNNNKVSRWPNFDTMSIYSTCKTKQMRVRLIYGGLFFFSEGEAQRPK
jgi:hypothetical protein